MRNLLAAAFVLLPSIVLSQASTPATRAELTAESNARVNGDAMEAANRTNADAALQQQVNALQATLSSVQAKAAATPPRYSVFVDCNGINWTHLEQSCSPEPFTIPAGKVFVVEQVMGMIVHAGLDTGVHARITFSDSQAARLYCKPLDQAFADCTQATRLNLSGTVGLTGYGNATMTGSGVQVTLAFYGFLADRP